MQEIVGIGCFNINNKHTVKIDICNLSNLAFQSILIRFNPFYSINNVKIDISNLSN